MSQPPRDWDIGKLPGWAQSALKESIEAPVGSNAQTFNRSEPGWPLLVDAAVVANFLPRELAPDVPPGESRTAAEKSVLGLAETVHDPSGLKWSLRNESRAAVLSEAIPSGDLADSLKRTENQFTDPVSRALRSFLTSQTVGPVPADLSALEATRTAVTLLAGVAGLHLPDIQTLEREIELKRLLAPFERMIGQSPGTDSGSARHQFFGREQELERLREYVGVIRASSLGATAGRALNWVVRTVMGRSPLAVWGVGGSGKTTLISKFVLEHAKAAVSKYPFVYLDFDRSTISPRNRIGLINEMCLQVGAQFESLTQPMAYLRARVSEFATGSAEAAARDSISRLYPYIQEFRKLIDDQMQSLESTFEFARPFLVVLDTFEIVQYAHEDVASLEEFLSAFAFGTSRSPWPRMRLIVSGRKQVTKFGDRTTEDLALGALDKKGSAQMLVALASSARKPISVKDSQQLVAVVAKATGEKIGGVQPLRLRLIGDIFSKAKEDGPTLVQSLITEFEGPLTPAGMAAQVLIDGVLVRRIIGHVGDARVRALADPGLVVRRITPDVIRNVMTRGTRKPTGVAETPDSLDEEVKEPWIVDQTEANDIFEAFKREVSLVETDGNALRHRQDVRQEMLPLIKARRPKRFAALHRVAFDYFLSLAKINPGDRLSAAEAVYHGLWIGQPLVELNTLWPADPSFDPRIDAEEFGIGTNENIFVRAKTHGQLMENEVKALPSAVALDWAVGRMPALLDQQRFDDRDVSLIRSVAGQSFEALYDYPETAAVLARLLYRCGLWDDSVRLARKFINPEVPDAPSSDPTIVSFRRTHLTIVTKSVERVSERISPEIEQGPKSDPLIAVEVCAHSFLYALRDERDAGQRFLPLLETAVSRVPRRAWNRELRILRLAILCGTRNVRELLRLYLQSKEWSPLDSELWSGEEPDWLKFAEVEQEYRKLRDVLSEPDGRKNREMANSFWRLTRERLARLVEKSDMPIVDTVRLVVYDHSDWVRCLGNALTRALRNESQSGNLSKNLLRQGFVESGGRRSMSHGDGLEIVRAIFDEGRLLDFAKAVPDWKQSTVAVRTLAQDERFSYPQDIFGLADIFLKWHTALLDTPMFSPDGQRIVTASSDKTAGVWDAASWQLLATLQGHTDSVASAVFSPDGQRIVTASSDTTARVWDAASWQLLATLQGHTNSVASAVFSPDGQRIVTASSDKTAGVWDAASWQLLATLQGHTDSVASAVFSPDGQRIVTASQDQTARVWDAASWQLLATLQGHTDSVASAVFSPDGQRIVTASQDQTARVWDAASGQLLTTLQGHTNSVASAVFSPDGQRIVTASSDKTARVWNAASCQLLATLQGHTDSVASAVFSPDGQRIVTASSDKTARVFRVVTLSEREELLAR